MKSLLKEKTYLIENQNITVTVGDVLKFGTYVVEIIDIDDKGYVHYKNSAGKIFGAIPGRFFAEVTEINGRAINEIIT